MAADEGYLATITGERVAEPRLSVAKLQSPLVATKSPRLSGWISACFRGDASSSRARLFHAERLAFGDDDDAVVK